MNSRQLLSVLFALSLMACTEHYDKGKEFTIEESPVTTAFTAQEYETNESCRECHGIIYDEFVGSMHFKSTIFRDTIFNAVWETHPNFANKTQFTCAQCHLPGADNIADFMEKGRQALPDINNATQNEAVSCATCHRIKSIEKHRHANRNIYNKKTQVYYGVAEGTSHVHEVDSDNKLYFNGDVCLGCHSHRENVNNYVVCVTETEPREHNSQSCVTCHMPMVPESGTSTKMDTKHFYHGFAGMHSDENMMEKYVDLTIEKGEGKGFNVLVHNRVPHDLFMHPLREGVLKVAVERDGKTVKRFEEITMQRKLENEEGLANCNTATKETQNSLVLGMEKKAFPFKFDIQAGDKINVELGYYLVKRKTLKTLKLEQHQPAKKYHVLKKNSQVF